MKALRLFFTTLEVLVVIVFVFNVALLVSGTKAFAVSTNSMEPALSTGDAVFVRDCDNNELAQGDIVTVKLTGSDKTFTHRVYRVDSENSLIFTKGDANAQPDPAPSKMSDIVGRVVFSLPLLGFISLKITGTTAIIIMASTMLIIVAAETLINIKRRKGEVSDK